MNLATSDLIVFIGYICLIVGFGIWISQREKNKTAKDYFLASSSLPWWAVGGSLIASNISTEQILAMNGSGYVMGLAIGAYELMAALTLIIVAKFFLPIFIKKGIYTMPQFLQERYDTRVRSVMAFFWLALFVFVNITSILYLGGLAIQEIMGVNMIWGIIGLVLYSATFSIFGGLKAVVWTDVAQVIILVIGGLVASFLVVSAVGSGSFFGGFGVLMERAPEKFDMILDKSNPSYGQLPGIGVLIGGMWIANIYYWGTNQYIIQRALAAKNIKEAQKGVAFAAFLKILMPLMVVVPGIAAFVILSDPQAFGFSGEGIEKPDEAFPWVLNNFVGAGFKGLVFAALVAAIGSSISSMVNSASTIFTLDIYKNLFKPNESESHYVNIGKIAAAGALIVGALVAPALSSLDQVFQYIQEYTGFISPGIVAVFIFGLFWKRATANAALIVVVLAIPLSWFFQYFFPELPFLSRMGFSFLVLSTLLVAISILEIKEVVKDRPSDRGVIYGIMTSILVIASPIGVRILIGDIDTPMIFGYLTILLTIVLFTLLLTENKADDVKGIPLEQNLFKTDAIFNVAAVAVFLILAAIYISLG